MKSNEILDNLESVLMKYVEKIATKETCETKETELNTMTEASKILCDIARMKNYEML